MELIISASQIQPGMTILARDNEYFLFKVNAVKDDSLTGIIFGGRELYRGEAHLDFKWRHYYFLTREEEVLWRFRLGC